MGGNSWNECLVGSGPYTGTKRGKTLHPENKGKSCFRSCEVVCRVCKYCFVLWLAWGILASKVSAQSKTRKEANKRKYALWKKNVRTQNVEDEEKVTDRTGWSCASLCHRCCSCQWHAAAQLPFCHLLPSLVLKICQIDLPLMTVTRGRCEDVTVFTSQLEPKDCKGASRVACYRYQPTLGAGPSSGDFTCQSQVGSLIGLLGTDFQIIPLTWVGKKRQSPEFPRAVTRSVCKLYICPNYMCIVSFCCVFWKTMNYIPIRTIRRDHPSFHRY